MRLKETTFCLHDKPMKQLLWCNKVPKGKRNKPAKINGIEHHEISAAIEHTYYRSLNEWTTNQFDSCPLPLDFHLILCHTTYMINRGLSWHWTPNKTFTTQRLTFFGMVASMIATTLGWNSATLQPTLTLSPASVTAGKVHTDHHASV